ncbi:MAG: hypothetical protein AB7O96_15100 [Pseudobdellovibrionaceae bacterium]
MDTKAYFQGLVAEASRLAHVKNVKKEIEKLRSEVKKIDLHAALPASAIKTVSDLNNRYKLLVKNLESKQKQIEKEVAKAITSVKKSAKDIEKALARLRKAKKSKKAPSRKTSKKTARKTTKN